MADETLMGDGAAVASHGPIAVGGLFAGRYEVEAVLGHGGMGTVYRARDRMVGDVVALKILDASVVVSDDQVAWFRREVRLARRITHPNVARTHDLGEHGGNHYITMELVAGGTLQDRLRGPTPESGRTLAVAEAARVALAVCDGLAAAHAAGVVHRDLKPANVLIEATGRVVLTDFGIARGLGDDGARTRGIVGTPQYMAPEQLSGLPVDARADLYALGLMLFEMLTGAVPFAGGSIFASALARVSQPPPDPRGLRPELPAGLAALILECLSREPGARPASATAVAERLRGWAGSEAATTGVTMIDVPAPVDVSATTRPHAAAMIGMTAGGSPAPAPMPAAGRVLAVLPLRYQGPPEQAYLGDALADELVDVLSRTRGMRVLGSGAAAKYRHDRDPRAVGAALGVTAVVDATVEATPTQLRVLARLVDVASGTQLWSDKFEAALEDLFELEDRMCKRIAEALRVELESAESPGSVPAEAIGLYLQGRRKLMAAQIVGPDGAVALLEACLRLAPGLRSALACRAIACVRAWFLPGAYANAYEARDWESEARTAVATACALAPDLAETHLASAVLAVQRGEWRDAVKSLGRALDIAPTYAHAHQYLAHLQCEAGVLPEGLERARLAYALEPSLRLAMMDVVRVLGLQGDRAGAEAALASIEPGAPFRGALVQARVRLAAYFGDMAAIRAEIDKLGDEGIEGTLFGVLRLARGMLGDASDEEVAGHMRELVAEARSPRFLTMTYQLGAEVAAVRGDVAIALEWFQRAADGGLIDLVWTDRCPLLAPLRGLPGFIAGRRKVRQRVQTMWRL